MINNKVICDADGKTVEFTENIIDKMGIFDENYKNLGNEGEAQKEVLVTLDIPSNSSVRNDDSNIKSWLVKICKIDTVIDENKIGADPSQGEIPKDVGIVKTIQDVIEWMENTIDFLLNWKENIIIFIENTCMKGLDAIQNFMNSLFSTNEKFFFSKDELMKEGENGRNNRYTKVTEYNPNSKKSWQIEKNIETNVKVKNSSKTQSMGFDENTKIPISSCDLYNLAKGNVELFNIDFLEDPSNNPGKEYNEGWLFLRNIIILLMRIIFYLLSALLITGLLIISIRIVAGTFSPEQRKKHKDTLLRLLKGTFLLVGMIVFISGSVKLTKLVWNWVDEIDQYESIIRVNVKDADKGIYSFSTGITGYARYIAQIDNPRLCSRKRAGFWGYVICTLASIVMIVLLSYRSLMIIALNFLGLRLCWLIYKF